MFVSSLSLLASGFAVAAHDSKIKNATNQVESGAVGLGDTVKGFFTSRFSK